MIPIPRKEAIRQLKHMIKLYNKHLTSDFIALKYKFDQFDHCYLCQKSVNFKNNKGSNRNCLKCPYYFIKNTHSIYAPMACVDRNNIIEGESYTFLHEALKNYHPKEKKTRQPVIEGIKKRIEFIEKAIEYIQEGIEDEK